MCYTYSDAPLVGYYCGEGRDTKNGFVPAFPGRVPPVEVAFLAAFDIYAPSARFPPVLLHGLVYWHGDLLLLVLCR
jgi:hypothetical protein